MSGGIPSDEELAGLSTSLLSAPNTRGRWDLVLLDRDGTLNVRREGYVERPDQLELLAGVVPALRRINAAGIPVVVVTNQQGVGKGLMTSADLVAVHRRLCHLLGPARLDAFAVCPHLAGTCDCRKPGTGLFQRVLARAPWADPRRCVMVGDSDSDLAPALRLGTAVAKVVSEPEIRPFDTQFVSSVLSV